MKASEEASKVSNGGKGRSTRFAALRDLMLDGRWRSLPEIASAIGLTDQNVTGLSAELRDLRKVKNGGYKVFSKRMFTPTGWISVYSMRAPTETEILARKESGDGWRPLRKCSHCGKKHRCLGKG